MKITELVHFTGDGNNGFGAENEGKAKEKMSAEVLTAAVIAPPSPELRAAATMETTRKMTAAETQRRKS